MSHKKIKLKRPRAWELFLIWRINTRSLESIIKLLGIIFHKCEMFTFCQANIYLMKMTFFLNLNKVTTFLPTVMCTSSVSASSERCIFIQLWIPLHQSLRPFEISHMFSFRSCLLITVEFHHEILIAGTTGFLNHTSQPIRNATKSTRFEKEERWNWYFSFHPHPCASCVAFWFLQISLPCLYVRN